MSVDLRFKHDSAGNPSAKVVESQTNASLWGRHSHFIRPKAQGPRGRGTSVGLLTNLPQFTMFCGFPIFTILWIKTDQHGATEASKCAEAAALLATAVHLTQHQPNTLVYGQGSGPT